MPPSYHFSDLKRNASIESRLSSNSPDNRLFSGRLFPSGRITVGYVPKKKVIKSDKEYERTRQQVVYSERTHWDYEEGLVSEILVRVEKDSSLGLSDVSNYHKEPVRRHGLKGIPSSGRYRVLEGATLLQRRHGRRLGFYTLTCPYTEDEKVYEFNKCFSEIMRRYFQEIKREYDRRGVTFSYTAVYEIQPDRYTDTGVSVLHCHYVAPCYIPNTYQFVLSSDEIRSIFARVCGLVVAPLDNYGACLDSQVVKKSASGYLAKYLSKGGKILEVIADVAPGQLPSRWWSCSRNVLHAMRKLTLELPQHICETLMLDAQLIASPLPFLYYIRRIHISVPWGMESVGIAATATPQFAESLRPMTWEDLLYQLL